MSVRNREISSVVWLLIFPAGFYGMWKHRDLQLAHLAIVIVLAVTAFGTLLTEEPYLRYRMPVDLLLTAFAGVAYGTWMGRRHEQRPTVR
jgi:Na+-transporting NADH:ubiquinone oxidoreductase subunit NqrB